MTAYAFAANGMEEVECLTVVDLLRRAGIDMKLVSINEDKYVTGAHDVTIVADMVFEEADLEQADLLFLPGGIPGTPNLAAHEGVCSALRRQNEAGRRIAAVCAAPSVLGGLGLLKGKKAVCYPGFEEKLTGAQTMCPEWNGVKPSAVTDGNITTSRGLGTAIDLGLELVGLLVGKEQAERLAGAIVYK